MTRVASIALASCALLACSRNPPAPDAQPRTREELPPPPPPTTSIAKAAPTPSPAPTAIADDDSPSALDASADDPMASHFETQADLLHLVWLPDESDPRVVAHRDAVLSYLVAPSPGHFNQGNRALAHHAITKRACLEGLRDVVIQTDEQRAILRRAEHGPHLRERRPALGQDVHRRLRVPEPRVRAPVRVGLALGGRVDVPSRRQAPLHGQGVGRRVRRRPAREEELAVRLRRQD